MTMFRYTVSALWLVAVLAACTTEPDPSEYSPAPAAQTPVYDSQDVLGGWIRIRLDDDAQPLKTGAFTRGYADSGNPDIDAIATLLGATEIKPVFPTDPRFEARHRKYGLHLWFDLKIADSIPVSRAQTDMASVAGVAHVQPIFKTFIEGAEYPFPTESDSGLPDVSVGNKRAMPFNDPYLPLQWHYDNDGSLPGAVEGADIGLFEAWRNITAGDPSVIVAIMDTGIARHVDLNNNIWRNEAEANGLPGVDDDGNGYVDDITLASVTDVYTILAHGTHVAGTVAAVNNNGIGVCGIAGGTGNHDGVRLMECPMTGYGFIDPSYFVYSADNGAVISQNSWSLPVTQNSTPKDMEVAIRYFINEAGTDANGNQTGPMKGGVVIFSAGNDARGSVIYPAADPNTIAVASMMHNYVKSGFSNYGPQVDFFAPGGAGSSAMPSPDLQFGDEARVLSTGENNSYFYMEGTSMACPHVTGVAALIVSAYGGPGFTNEDLKTILFRCFRSVGNYQRTPEIAAGIGIGLIDASLIDLENPETPPAPFERVYVVEQDDSQKKDAVLTLHFDNVPVDANGLSTHAVMVAMAPVGTPENSPLWRYKRVTHCMPPGSSFEAQIDSLAGSTEYVFRAMAEDRFQNRSTFVECFGSTIHHQNRPPNVIKPFERILFPIQNSDGSQAFELSLDLSEYMYDPDMPYDDMLTYSAVCNDETIVIVSVTDTVMYVRAVSQGNAMITVTLVDRAGESVSRNILVAVKQDPPVFVPDLPSDNTDSLALILSPNPAHDAVTLEIAGYAGHSAQIAVFDSAARRIFSESVTIGSRIDISSLSAGLYSVVLSLDNGYVLQNTFVKM